MLKFILFYVIHEFNLHVVVRISSYIFNAAKFSKVDERKFIRRRSIVDEFIFLPFSDDCMAEGQKLEIFEDRLMLRIFGIFQRVQELPVSKVDVGDFGERRDVFDVIQLPLLDLTIGYPVDAHFLEFHDVAGKSAGFIGKYIFDLAQFLVEVG